MNSNTIKRLVIYVSSALIPPLMFGTLTAMSNFKSLMLRERPASLELPNPLPQPTLRAGKLKAAILVSNDGTQITDLLGPYALLAESGAFDVYTVAASRQLSQTTGDLAILPDFTFKDAPQADLVVVPALLEPGYPSLQDWLRAQAQSAKILLSVCEGARVSASAGLLDGYEATSHFISLKQLRERHPNVKWTDSSRVIVDRNRISTAGVTASLDGTIEAIERLAGAEAAARARALMPQNWAQDSRSTSEAVSRRDWAQLYLRAGFDWTRPGIAVWITPGASELALASALDQFPRTQSARVFSVSEKRQLIRTAHGLWVAPSEKMELAPPASFVVVPETSREPASAHDSALKWSQMAKAQLIDWRGKPGAEVFPLAHSWIGAREGSAIASFVAKTIELPNSSAGIDDAPVLAAPSWPARLFWPPLGMGAIGLLIGIWMEKRFRLVR